MNHSHAHAHGDLKRKAAFASMAASALLAIMKLLAGYFSGSLALLSEGGHAALDIVMTALTYFAIRAADRPADENHPYGHFKIESLAALIETIFLFILASFVMWEAIARLYQPSMHELNINYWIYVVLLVSMGVDAMRWRALTRVAKTTGSVALAADALHFSSDFVASILVLVGIGLSAFGMNWGDALAAVGVAGFIAVAGWRLGRRTIDHLLDTVPHDLRAAIDAVFREVPQIEHIESLKLRPHGNHIAGEVEVRISRTLSFEEIQAVKEEMRARLVEQFPHVQLTIVATPTVLESESTLERVLLVAARHRTPVHHITIQTIEDKKSISLDVELDEDKTLQAAHEIVTKLEYAIRDEIPGCEVETHIEPLRKEEIQGADADGKTLHRVKTILEAQTAIIGIDMHVHNVRVRQTFAGLVVNYHCRLVGDMTVAKAHEYIDKLDHGLRQQSPDVIRSVGHAEPLNQD